jgi:recA bacterial DNA recombination protein
MPFAALKLAQLESLLTARKLDHTLVAQHGSLAGDPVARPWGDLPRGQMSEIVGPRSSGRQAVLVSWLAAATARGELTALVDPLDMFDPPSAAAAGVDLARLLWVRGHALGPDRVSLPREVGDLRAQVDRAVKAVNLILQAGGFGLVALDFGEMPLPVIGRLPFTTWRRLHRVIAGGETAGVVVAGESLARSVGGVTLALAPAVHHRIEGRLIHARGMRTERVVFS